MLAQFLPAGDARLFWRLNFICALILGSYGIALPTTQALFLSAYGAENLPWAWLAVTAASVATVVAVGRLTASRPLHACMRLAALASAAALVMLLVAVHANVPYATFALYVWKDIYVVVLVELFWTFANIAYAQEAARRTYGWFCAAGTLGGLLGSAWVSFLAQSWGTLLVLWTVVPLLAATAIEARVTRTSRLSPTKAKAPPAWHQAPAFLRESPYVGWLILLVGLVQAAMAVMDFQFNQAIELQAQTLDERAHLVGRVQGNIHLVSLALQAATGPILRMIGLPMTLVAIPLVLAGALAAALVVPGMGAIVAAKVMGKSADYSLFRAAKEMLYIPLTLREKTFGKALVDMLVYRVAKGAVSVLVMALVRLRIPQVIGSLSLALVVGWLLCTWRIVVLYRRLAGGEDAARARAATMAAGVALLVAAAAPPAWARGEDPTGVGKSFTRPDLFVHAPGDDLSAWRVDCDVFGWNKSLTEVGAVGSDIHRYPKGKHRGEVFLLVYRVADGHLLHNVITHNVTHADLPTNPVPLDDVRDLMWTIEGTFLQMWPHRPKYSRPPGGMRVTPLWAAVPTSEGCVPHTAAVLAAGKTTALASFRPADMTTDCALLKKADHRVYWANDYTAAQMVRFDFGAQAGNEKSARFVHPLAWAERTQPRVAVDGEVDGAATVARVARAAPFAVLDQRHLRRGNPRATALQAVHTQADFAALGHYLRHRLGPEAPLLPDLPPAAAAVALTFGEGEGAGRPASARLGEDPDPDPDPPRPLRGASQRRRAPPARQERGDFIDRWTPP